MAERGRGVALPAVERDELTVVAHPPADSELRAAELFAVGRAHDPRRTLERMVGRVMDRLSVTLDAR